jgi:hypothetical protein
MFIISYNHRLAWVVVPAVIWALLGLSLALGITSPRGEDLRAGLRLGVPEGGLHLRGHVVNLTETDDGLRIVLAVPELLPPPLPELPHNVHIEVVAGGKQMLSRPQIELSSESRLRELPGGRFAVVTADHIVLFGHGDLRLIKRPPGLANGRLQEWLERGSAAMDRRAGRSAAERRRPPRRSRPPVPIIERCARLLTSI